MNEYLKSYKVHIDVKTPLYIGSEKTINKKEFIYDSRKNLLSIINLEKLSLALCQKKLFNSYTKYMTDSSDNNLYLWLKDNGFTKEEINGIMSYKLSCNGFIGKKYKINTFVKDAYNCPYIPRSSLKGYLRTILLGYELLNNHSKYTNFADEIRRNSFNTIGRLEKEVFNVVDCGDDADKMSMMSGLIVSDSEPVAIDELTICQKYDKMVNSKGKSLPIYFEVLKPYTRLSTTITINTRIFKYDIEYIKEAIDSFAQNYYDRYLSEFSSIKKRPDNGTIWLGGNTGFIIKTILHNLFDKKESLKLISTELKYQFKKHRHEEDFRSGVSPRMLNCCLFEGGKPPMGEAILSFKKI